MRTVGILLFCCALARAGVEPRLVGTWSAKFNNISLTWEISDSGAYIVRAEGEGSPPGEYGTLEAEEGRWSIRACNFRTDAGSYRFDGDDKVTVTGRAGGLAWERIGKDVAFEKPPTCKGNAAGLTVADVLAGAKAHAHIWQPDAVLVGVNGLAARDGTFNITAAPSLNLTFHSPATNQGLLVTPVANGDFVWLAGPTPMQNLTVPLAEEFLDVPAAFEKAAAQGFAVQDVNPVALRAWSSVAGESDRTCWQLGHQPMLSKAFYLDATTGEKLTYDRLTGNEERQRRIAEWEKGTRLALPDDFAAWRREAQAWAEKWAPGQTPYEAWVTGNYTGGSLRISFAVFHFYSESKGARGPEYRSVSVAVNSGSLNGRRGGTLKVKPAALPDDVLDPSKAARVLWGLNPQVPSNCTYLQLMHLSEGEEAPRGWPDRFGYSRSNVGGIFLQRGPVPKGERWIWRMIARRAGAETGVGLGGNYRSHIGAVHCDARTGEALDAPAPDLGGNTKFR